MVVRILPPRQNVHVPRKVGPLIGHPGAPIHTDGVAAAQVGVKIRAVAVTLIETALEIFVFIEGDLKDKQRKERREVSSSPSSCRFQLRHGRKHLKTEPSRRDEVGRPSH